MTVFSQIRIRSQRAASNCRSRLTVGAEWEVDLLCPIARLAIELDGSHHLGNVEAYRRDRRKDQLLQENGYFVLRFLAEDVGKNLDFVLDTIERVVVSLSARSD